MLPSIQRIRKRIQIDNRAGQGKKVWRKGTDWVFCLTLLENLSHSLSALSVFENQILLRKFISRSGSVVGPALNFKDLHLSNQEGD